jgi:hypothetical protein
MFTKNGNDFFFKSAGNLPFIMFHSELGTAPRENRTGRVRFLWPWLKAAVAIQLP